MGALGVQRRCCVAGLPIIRRSPARTSLGCTPRAAVLDRPAVFADRPANPPEETCSARTQSCLTRNRAHLFEIPWPARGFGGNNYRGLQIVIRHRGACLPAICRQAGTSDQPCYRLPLQFPWDFPIDRLAPLEQDADYAPDWGLLVVRRSASFSLWSCDCFQRAGWRTLGWGLGRRDHLIGTASDASRDRLLAGLPARPATCLGRFWPNNSIKPNWLRQSAYFGR